MEDQFQLGVRLGEEMISRAKVAITPMNDDQQFT
jgi:hypothetical protein